MHVKKQNDKGWKDKLEVGGAFLDDWDGSGHDVF
jgi:hypothetical protein